MPIGMFDFYTRAKPPSSEELAVAYQPYIETCIAAFGVDRGMFESKFPPKATWLELSDLVERTSNGLWPVIRHPGEGGVVQRHGEARLPPTT